VNLDLPLIVDLHGLGLRDREFVERRNRQLCDRNSDAERACRPSSQQISCSSLLRAMSRIVRSVLAFASVPGDGNGLSIERRGDDLFDCSRFSVSAVSTAPASTMSSLRSGVTSSP
jgi:hypothetical protein